MNKNQVSSGVSNSWPSSYKIANFEINYDTSLYFVHRQTYDVLSLISDLGGLLFGLYWIGWFVIGWYSYIGRSKFYISRLFYLENQDEPVKN